jgi:hypothetical protein
MITGLIIGFFIGSFICALYLIWFLKFCQKEGYLEIEATQKLKDLLKN